MRKAHKKNMNLNQLGIEIKYKTTLYNITTQKI